MISGDRANPIVSFVPERFREARLERLSRGLQNAIAESPREGLLLWGPTGRGKTYAMAAIANVTCQKGEPAAKNWIDFDELCRDIRTYWKFTHSSDQRSFDPIAWAVRAPWLWVDDLGQERDEKGREFFESVVLGRYDANRGMCVTTNLTPDELKERYGGRVASRLTEICEVLEIDGVDRRLQAVS